MAASVSDNAPRDDFAHGQGRRIRRLRWRLGCPLLALLVAGGFWASRWRHMPETHGQIMDAQTGKPIAGAWVGRQLYGPPPFDLVDTRTERPIKGGWAETRCDADGRFVLPAMRARGMVAMAWTIWAPGYMPGAGCYRRKGWFQGSCSGHGDFRFPADPWVLTTFTNTAGHVQMDTRLFPPTLEGVTFLRWDVTYTHLERYSPKPGEEDPWGEYFRRLTSIPGWLPDRSPIDEVVAYLRSGGKVTAVMLSALADFSDHQLNKEERCLILRAMEGFCHANPKTKECGFALAVVSIRQYNRECR